MAGHGPAPKDPNKRVRGAKSDVVPLRVVVTTIATQPELVDVIGELNPLTETPWTTASLLLWRQLGSHPATGNLVEAQWSQLARAVMCDDAALSGMPKMTSEARLRFAKFFIDPDDMLRGRIVTAQAEGADQKIAKGDRESSRKRYGGSSRAVASD